MKNEHDYKFAPITPLTLKELCAYPKPLKNIAYTCHVHGDHSADTGDTAKHTMTLDEPTNSQTFHNHIDQSSAIENTPEQPSKS